MNSVNTITIDSQVRPIALRRSSIKVTKETSPEDPKFRSNSTSTTPEQSNHYTNLKAHRDSQQATRISIDTRSQTRDSQHKQIKLVIANNNNTNNNNKTDITTAKPQLQTDQIIKDSDTYLTTLTEEYQLSLNRKDCDNSSCHRFKLLSYRISQTLFERINALKNDLQLAKKSNGISRTSIQRKASFQSNSDRLSCTGEAGRNNSNNMDQDGLLNLVNEKNKRIQDLERLVEDQRRLRLQDASQVEEKAARIKEWVANKLKELENQNKQLRDQNRKQKEAVESLSNKLATMSPISSPRRNTNTQLLADGVQYIDQNLPIEAIDIEKSLKMRRPHLKKSYQTVLSSLSDDDGQTICVKLDSGSYQMEHDETVNIEHKSTERTLMVTKTQDVSSHNHHQESAPTRRDSSNSYESKRQGSPVYDSVTVEQINRRVNKNSMTAIQPQKTGNQDTQKLDQHADQSGNCVPPPPPPPLHQSDKWELQLYNLADETLSSLIKQHQELDEKCNESYAQPDSIESISASDKEMSVSRKSSSSFKNDLISLVKPTFTTIDGDHVVDSFADTTESIFLADPDKSLLIRPELHTNFSNHLNDHNHPYRQSCEQLNRLRKDSADSCELIDSKPPTTPSLFDSPMRSRSGKDNILRTQSVRRNPAPEKLYDFIIADLIKRGYLIKPGALKNHNRWFVLKNFHLYSYKCSSDETTKANPNMVLKLDKHCQVQVLSQSSDSSFPFKLTYSPDKSLQLIAETGQIRDEWIRILTVTINMSDIEADALKKDNSTFEGLMSVTRHGHTKRCYATLINHVIFFLKSLTDPTPMSYLSIKGARIREITDNYDYDFEEQELIKQKNNFQDCSLAVYPKYSMNSDPVYITLGGQLDTDKWFYFLSIASGVDQSYGTQFERTLTRLMINNSVVSRRYGPGTLLMGLEGVAGCLWKEQSVMLYSDRPITQPLTTLPNETLRVEAIELFKSILLFTQVPLEPVAIDYHVCLLQNCLGRFLKYPELRNEFYAQLVKQCTYVLHRCNSSKLSSSSSGYSPIDQRSSINSLSPSSSECQFITDIQQLDALINDRGVKIDACLNVLQQNSVRKDRSDSLTDDAIPPSQSELLQVMQIQAVAVSLNLPRGRMRWWLMDLLRKFANPDTNIGKYALYTLKAINRTITNGTRDNVPSRTEIMSILLRNPFDHSNPHSLPVSFADGSYLVVEADGSTTVDEFMLSMSKYINVRHSLVSDFYLFADDPSGSKELHILEPQRKVLDIVGWWEQTFRRHNSGRYQNTKVIRLICKKRLLLRPEVDETPQERLLVVHQMNQEVISHRIPINEALILELGAIMAQLTYGDFDSKSKDPKVFECIMEKISTSFLAPNISSPEDQHDTQSHRCVKNRLIERWQQLSSKSAQDCVRVYLNCIRRLKLSD